MVGVSGAGYRMLETDHDGFASSLKLAILRENLALCGHNRTMSLEHRMLNYLGAYRLTALDSGTMRRFILYDRDFGWLSYAFVDVRENEKNSHMSSGNGELKPGQDQLLSQKNQA